MNKPTRSTLSRSRFLSLGSGGAIALLAGCSGGGGGGALPAPAQQSNAIAPVSTAAPTAAPVSTSATAQASGATIVGSGSSGTLPAMLAGLSYEKAEMSLATLRPSNTSLIGCLKTLGPSIVRIGGNSVDKTTWSPAGPGSASGSVSPADVDALAAFAQAAGWKVLYGINLATNTPALAALEAAYVVKSLGSALYGFEIGNECDLYASNGYRPSTYSVTDFIAEWTLYADAIEIAAPGAVLTGAACASNYVTWTLPFAAAVGSKLTLLTQHYYRGNGLTSSATIPLMLSPDTNVPPALRKLASTAAANGITGGIRFAECNSFYNGGAPGVSDAFASALWAVDFLMTNAANGSAGVNFHGGGQSSGYTPIADNGSTVVDVRPEYYGMLLVSQIAPGPMMTVDLTTSLDLTAYAVRGGDGATYVVLVNKDASDTMLTVALASSASKAFVTKLTGPSLAATSGQTLGGAAVANDGTWSPISTQPIAVSGSSLAVTVSAGSAMLLKVV